MNGRFCFKANHKKLELKKSKVIFKKKQKKILITKGKGLNFKLFQTLK